LRQLRHQLWEDEVAMGVGEHKFGVNIYIKYILKFTAT
jgi:hypothetical protein